MSLFYQHNINAYTKAAVWKIEEPEDFFLRHVPLQTSITHHHKRLQHLAGRYLLKLLFPDFPFYEIQIADTRKPYLPYEQYHFSISHCGDYAAAIASTRQRCGIDIEYATERLFRVGPKFLHASEKSFVHEAMHDALRVFTTAWAVKEAVFKWWGWGSVDFSDHILLQPFALQKQGSVHVLFKREKQITGLTSDYILFENLCLAWLLTDEEGNQK